jgi:site-specific DNA-cytosine methylase
MKVSKCANDERRLEEVRERFEQWRDSRNKRGRIPDALWQAAATLHPAYSLHQISKSLHLNHTKLRQCIHEQQAVSSLPATPAAFIDLGLSDAITPCECIVEMQHQDGAQMRVQVKGGGRLDLMKLIRQFWSRP